MIWKDKKDNFIMSTVHDGSMQSRIREQREGLEELKPIACVEYNEKMTCVDMTD